MKTFKSFITELSKKTLGSYVKKASDSAAIEYGHHKTKEKEAHNLRNATNTNDIPNHLKGHINKAGEELRKIGAKNRDKAVRRVQGISRAVDRLTKEDIEQLDELSKKTLGSYINKAAKSGSETGKEKVYSGVGGKQTPKHVSYSSIRTSRLKGIALATKKLAKEDSDLQEFTSNSPQTKDPNYKVNGKEFNGPGSTKAKESLSKVKGNGGTSQQKGRTGNGEKTPIKQGSSDVGFGRDKGPSSQTPARRGDKRNGMPSFKEFKKSLLGK